MVHVSAEQKRRGHIKVAVTKSMRSKELLNIPQSLEYMLSCKYVDMCE